MSERKIISVIDNNNDDGDGSVGYIYLPDHPGKGTYKCVAKSVDLSEVIKNFKGSQILLDFDKNDVLIGIEILD